MENKKMTKKEMYNLIATLCADDQAIVDFCAHEVELLEKKKNSGSAKNATKATEVQDLILESLAEKDNVTATELTMDARFAPLANEYGIVSTQKLTAGLTALVKAGKVTKNVVKGRAYFVLGAPTEKAVE